MKIKILGKDIEVKEVHLKGLHGDFDGDKMLIRVHKGLSPENRQLTIKHELFHSALFISGVNELLTVELEEAIVRCLEHSLAEYIVDF